MKLFVFTNAWSTYTLKQNYILCRNRQPQTCMKMSTNNKYDEPTKFPHLRNVRKCFGPWSFVL